MIRSSISFCLSYLSLRDGREKYAAKSEVIFAILVSLIFVALWNWANPPNTFHKDGLIDRLCSFISILSGFFVAGLVAIATFSKENSSLDDDIVVGPVFRKVGAEFDSLSRRQYVCFMFGYMVISSFALVVTGLAFSSFAPVFSRFMKGKYLILCDVAVDARIIFASIIVFIWFLVLFHLLLVTIRGVYYLMDKLYDVRPVIKSRDEK